MSHRFLLFPLLLASAMTAFAADEKLSCTIKAQEADIQVGECEYAADDLASAYAVLRYKLHTQAAEWPPELPTGNRIIHPEDEAFFRYIKWISADEVVVADEGRSGNLRFRKATLRRENGYIAIDWLSSE